MMNISKISLVTAPQVCDYNKAIESHMPKKMSDSET